ncbi:MAG: protein-L-isoaspartate(D-aspartate) O-methyltransferase [Rhodovibrionaceae bacterium]
MSTEARKIRLLMQLRRAGVGDTKTLAAIEKIPRDAFTPPSFRDQAYENIALPIGQGQTLSQPQVVAMMTEALRLNGKHRVLEIGTGSGYQAAVLSRICRRVYTIERYRELLETAEERFQELRLHNVTARLGDGALGWPEAAPFDRIIVTCAASELPEKLFEQLAEGGIMVLPLGASSGSQELVRVIKKDGKMLQEDLGSVRFVPLVPNLPQDGRESA